MERVTGIGGVFFKGKNADLLREWYREHLGIETHSKDGYIFEEAGETTWSIFPEHSTYFEPGRASFMVNYRVADLHVLLEELRREGVEVDDKVDESEYGKFGWIVDPEGNRIELWEPPAKEPTAK